WEKRLTGKSRSRKCSQPRWRWTPLRLPPCRANSRTGQVVSSGGAAERKSHGDAGAAAAVARVFKRHRNERLARGVEVGLDRRERRVDECAGSDAVEADQRNIGRHAAPRVLEPLQHPESEHVTCCEDRVD